MNEAAGLAIEVSNVVKHYGERPVLDGVSFSAQPGETVREIAASCGLTRMATLIPEYAARFGERPSDTLRGRVG